MRSVGAKTTKINDNVKTVPYCHLCEAISLIACICQSLHLAKSANEIRQNTSHFVMKLQNLSYAKVIILKWIYASWKCTVDK